MSDQRVAIFLQDLEGGGTERSMTNLMQGLVAQGIPVDLVIVNFTGPFVSQVPREVRVIKLGTRSVSRSVWALAKYLRRERPAAMLTALTHVNIVAVLARMVSRTKVRLVISERSYASVARGYYRRFSFMRMAYAAIPWLYRKADGIISVSDGTADDLAKLARLDRSRITTIFNPVVTPELLRRAGEPVNHPWFNDGNIPVLLSVGRLVELKDFPTLLRAFELVRRQRPAKLIILGEGPKREELMSLAKQLGIEADVDMPGFVNNPYAWMARAALLVCSSRVEGIANTLVEAMACGTPAVSTDCPTGPREVLCGGQYGRLVGVGDFQALGEAMLQSLEQPVPASTLRERSMMFSMEQSTRAHVQLLLGDRSMPASSIPEGA